MAIKILTLEGLQDSRLGELLAQLVETVPGVKSAKFDFLSRKLTMDIEGRKSSDTVAAVTVLMRKTFPNVTVKHTEVGVDAPPEKPKRVEQREPYIQRPSAPPPPPPPAPAPPPQQLDWDDLDELEELEELPQAEEQPAEEKPKKQRPVVGFSARVSISLAAVGVSVVLLIVYLLLPFGGVLRDLPAVLALLLSAAALLELSPAHGSPELRALTIMTALISGASFALGERIPAVVTMLVCHVGLTVVAILSNRLDRQLEKSIDISPETISRLNEGRTERVPLRQVLPGMQISVRDGETIPFDGVIRDGLTEVDRSLLSGSAEPVPAGPDDRVYCGDRNLKAPIVMGVTGVQESSVAWKLKELAFDRKKRGTVLPRRWSVMLVLTLVVLTAGTALRMLWGLPVTEWFQPVLLLLLAGAPCGAYAAAEAIRLSGLLLALRKGMLLDGGKSFDQLTPADTVVAGYTGVMTTGEFRVAELDPADEYSENELLRYAAFVESECDHPIAKAIMEEYKTAYGKGLVPSDDIAMCEDIPGKGVRGMVDRRVTFAGSERLMREVEVPVPPNSTGKVCVYVAVRGDYVGRIILEDALRPGAESFVESLQRTGTFHTVLLTGCDEAVARTAGEALGFDEVLPEQIAVEKPKAMDALLAQAHAKRQTLLFLGSSGDLPLFSLPCLRVLLGRHTLSSMLGVVDAALPSGDPSKLGEMLQLCRSVSRLAVVGIFASYALKWILLGCMLFLPVPLYAVALADILPPLALFGIAVSKLR